LALSPIKFPDPLPLKRGRFSGETDSPPFLADQRLLDSKTDAGRESKTDAGRERKTDAGRESKTDAGRESKTDAGRESKTDAGRESKTDAGRERKTDAGRESKTDADREVKVTFQSEVGDENVVDLTRGDDIKAMRCSARVPVAVLQAIVVMHSQNTNLRCHGGNKICIHLMKDAYNRKDLREVLHKTETSIARELLRAVKAVLPPPNPTHTDALDATPFSNIIYWQHRLHRVMQLGTDLGKVAREEYSDDWRFSYSEEDIAADHRTSLDQLWVALDRLLLLLAAAAEHGRSEGFFKHDLAQLVECCFWDACRQADETKDINDIGAEKKQVAEIKDRKYYPLKPNDAFFMFVERHKKLFNYLCENDLRSSHLKQVLLRHHGQLLAFKLRREFFHQQLSAMAPRESKRTAIDIKVRRGRVFEDSYFQLKDVASLAGQFNVQVHLFPCILFLVWFRFLFLRGCLKLCGRDISIVFSFTQWTEAHLRKARSVPILCVCILQFRGL
jgi:hypothetical protein